jgi:wobble nucleotide-excising tRNase
MATTQRVREPVGTAKEKVEWTESVAKLFTTGVARMAEVQKKSLDIAAQQNAELVDLWKKAIQKIPGSPGLFVAELQASGFERYAEMHKAAIDLVVDQSKAFADLVKDRTATATRVNEDVDNFAKKSMERVVAMQKKALDQSAAQAKAVVETTGRQFGEGTPVEAAADSMQRGMNAIVDAQKELLDMAVR